MVTTIGDSTKYSAYLADNSTPASGSYAWYFLCDNYAFNIRTPSISTKQGSTEIHASSQISTSTKTGIFIMKMLFINVKLTDGQEDEMLRAVQNWNTNNTLLYINYKNDSSNNVANVPNSDQSGTVVARVKIDGISNWRLDKGAGQWLLNLEVGLYSA